jgi:hypothetical protein
VAVAGNLQPGDAYSLLKLGLLDPGDLGWILRELPGLPTPARDTIARCVAQLARHPRAGEADLILGMDRVVELTLANQGQEAISYRLTPNDYQGRTQTVPVTGGSSATISWPADQYGYYDVVITASPAGGFRRRYAGRIA